MSKVIKTLITLIAGVGVISASTGVWTNRAFFRVNEAKTHGKGKLLLHIVHLHGWYRAEEFDTVKAKWGAGDISFGLGYSVNKNLEIGLTGTFYIDALNLADKEGEEGLPDHASRGWGDTKINLKYVMPFSEGKIWAGANLIVSIPTGEKKRTSTSDWSEYGVEYLHWGGLHRIYTTEALDYGLVGLFGYYPNEFWSINLNLGYYNIFQKSGYADYPNYLITGLAVEYFPLNWFGLIGEYWGADFIHQDEEHNYYGTGPHFVSFGLRLGDKFAFKAGIDIPVSKRHDGEDKDGIKGEEYIPQTDSLCYFPSFNPSIAVDFGLSAYISTIPEKPKPKFGAIVINVVDEKGNPLDANIVLKDSITCGLKTVLGKVSKDSLHPGLYTIVVSKEGYESSTEKAIIKADTTTTVKIVLKEIIGELTLKVISRDKGTPVEAKVTILKGDKVIKEDIAKGGKLSLKLKPGKYLVKVKAEKFMPAQKEVEIEAHKTLETEVPLVKKGTRIVLRGIHFKSGSAEILPESYPILDEAAKILKENPTIIVEVQGHTDSRGSARYNLKLSQRRAEAVVKYLVEKHGIDPKRLIPKGYGESRPIASNATPEGRALNRRVEFKILGEIKK